MNEHLKRNQDVIQSYGKIPPQAIELEKAVIAAILIDKEAMLDVADILTPEMFYSHDMQLIFLALQTLFTKNIGIDVLTLSDQLKKQGDLEEVGGMFGVSKLTDGVFSAAHVTEHAFIIKQKYIRRELITLSYKTTHDAFDDTIEDMEVLTNHESELQKVVNNTQVTGERTTEQILNSIFTKKTDHSGIPVLNALRNRVSKLSSPDLIILAARPSMGKTAYALQIAKETAQQGKAVAIFSLEMSAEQLVKRLLSSECDIPYERVNEDKIFDQEQEKYMIAVNSIGNLPILIDDTPSIHLLSLKAKAARMKRKHEIGLIVIDYIQLMTGDTKGNREQEISGISRGLKALAKTLEVPVIALSQLSRKCEERADKKPMLSDLRESGAIEQDADIVCFLYRPEYYGIERVTTEIGETSSAGIAEIITAKNRNGKTGSSICTFLGEYMKFNDVHNLTPLEAKFDLF